MHDKPSIPMATPVTNCLIAISGDPQSQVQIQSTLPPMDAVEILLKSAMLMLGEIKKAQSKILVPQPFITGMRG